MAVQSCRGLSSLRRLLHLSKPQYCVVKCGLASEAIAVEEGNGEKLEVGSLGLKYPEFLPCPNLEVRNYMREKLEHKDMMKRRSVMNIPEFYVGSLVAITTSDFHSPGKSTRFMGICISRSGYGLAARCILRNAIDRQGVEIIYFLYSPTIQKIDVIRLEKRLDNELFYLRDAPIEYSTFKPDTEVEYRNPNDPVPINTLQVPLNPRPWLQRYERMDLQGAILPPLPEKFIQKAKAHVKPWEKYDLMDSYRKTIPEEEQQEIFSDICGDLKKFEAQQMHEKKKIGRKRVIQKLF